MADKFDRQGRALGPHPMTPSTSQKLVTPDDDADLPDGVCKALEVIAVDGGTVVNCVAESDGDEENVSRDHVFVGQIIQVRARRVLETTTATVVALY